jgi:regulator of nucleoside diphosphate kinase
MAPIPGGFVMYDNVQEPHIIVSNADYERLSSLAASARDAGIADDLAEELARAEVVDAWRLPPNVVAMGSTVEYVEQPGKTRRRVTLVYPGQEDIALGRISILTPIGTALLGLSVGQSGTWVTRSGQRKTLVVAAVTNGSVTDGETGKAAE